MRSTIPILAALGLLGCWADFPPELLRADAARDLPSSESRPDRAIDGPRADRPGDGPQADLPGDGPRADRPGDGPRADHARDGAREAGGDLTPSDAIPDARVLLALGTPCTTGAQCASNRCSRGLCCNASCTGTCMTCALAGQEGRCSFVANGADPHGDCAADALASCKLDGTCDGRGACRNYPAGTLVSAAACAGASNQKLKLASFCDGSGAPIPGAELVCDPYTCDPAIKRCRATCSSAGDCATGSCAGGRCNGKDRAPGADCSKKQDCVSGVCVDGVCCASACSGLCQRCDLSGLEGQCTSAFAGTDPDGDCAASAGPCAGPDGQCDGKGACRGWLEGTPCAAASCTGSSLTLFGTCAAGACVPSTVSCGSYACLPAGDGCYAFCSALAHCKPGCTCNTSSWSCEGSC